MLSRSTPSEGVYFVVRFPVVWRLVVFRFDEHHEWGHSEFWEEDVARELATAWAPWLIRNVSGSEFLRRKNRLRFALMPFYDGFPRGRIALVGKRKRYVIYHGSNLQRSMRVTRRMIEEAFGLTGRADWQFDEHEQCSMCSANDVRKALRLREEWKTTTVDFT